MKKILFYIFVLLLIPSIVWAACSGGPTNWTAASPNRSDIVDCFTACDAGAGDCYDDIITVPDGTGTGWTSGLTIQQCITLQAANEGQTRFESSTDFQMIDIAPDVYSISTNCAFRVTGFVFDGNFNDDSVGISIGQTHTEGSITKNIRIDHNEFIDMERAGVHRSDNSYAYALIDNNTFTDCRKALNAYGAYTYSWQMEPTAQNSLGTNESIFLEDNIINFTNARQSNATISSGHGGRWVSRFNTINYNQTTWYIQGDDMHGNNGSSVPATCQEDCSIDQGSPTCCDDANRGVVIAESYNNTHNLDGSQGSIKAQDVRGGTVMIFDNDYVSAGSSWTGYTLIREEDGADGIGCSGGISNWESCYDPVRDTYIFNNKNTYGNTEASISEYAGEAEYVEPDYNYWKLEAAFDGSSGIGRGTKATMAAIETCTQYTAFWVTDEGEWNSINAGADGRLYRCNDNDTFVLYYTPYTYPHPLADDESAPPAGPTGITGLDVD